ncbi:MAG: type II CRISPR-associated endonuclease Cas1 [Candidatus Cloacimonetes bacterium]|nr:type II CRISPR-associated endonuclease Cas1 [Candidatus Cloacimonadota bacterium]
MRRILEIDCPARLSLRNSQIVLKSSDETAQAPLEDVSVLVLTHPQISVTHCLLGACSEAGVVVIICNSRRLPESVLLPLSGASLHTKYLAQQVNMTQRVKDRLWKQVVQAKISEQAYTLKLAGGKPRSVKCLVSRVRVGDSTHCEARAAANYWPLLLGSSFRRDPLEPDVNALLNYGYALIRAAVARAIVATGLHPSLGIHHHSQYDSLCLADDLMEPLRPRVDTRVFELTADQGLDVPMTRENKHHLLKTLTETCNIDDVEMPMVTALQRYAASLRHVIGGKRKELVIPGRL